MLNRRAVPSILWAVIVGCFSTGTLLLVAFMTWMATTTVSQGKIISRLDAEIENLRRYVELIEGRQWPTCNSEEQDD